KPALQSSWGAAGRRPRREGTGPGRLRQPFQSSPVSRSPRRGGGGFPFFAASARPPPPPPPPPARGGGGGPDPRAPRGSRWAAGRARPPPPILSGLQGECVPGMIMSFFRRPPWWKKSRGWKDLPRRWGRKARLSLEQLEDRVVPTLGMTLFELDGNTVDSLKVAGDDWDTLFAGSGSAMAYTGVLADAAPDNTTFTSSGSKDINDLDQWEWGPGSVPNKSDILNAYAAAYVANDELNVFLGQDR